MWDVKWLLLVGMQYQRVKVSKKRDLRMNPRKQIEITLELFNQPENQVFKL